MRADGDFWSGPGDADCGEPYRDQYEAKPGGTRREATQPSGPGRIRLCVPPEKSLSW